MGRYRILWWPYKYHQPREMGQEEKKSVCHASLATGNAFPEMTQR